MSLDKRSVTFLLNLVQERPPSRAIGAVARHLSGAHSIGSLSGTNSRYTSTDFQRAADLLRLNGIDPSTAPDAWRAVGRTDAAALRGNEKWAGQAVSSGLVAVTCIHGQNILAAGSELALPAHAHLVLPVEDVAETCRHSTLIVVENFESFRRCSLWALWLFALGDPPGQPRGAAPGGVLFPPVGD